MQVEVKKKEIAKRLQAKINALQGFGKTSGGLEKDRLQPFSEAFPNHIFPIAAVHEFVSYEPAHAASTSGFITALTGKIMKSGDICLWIGNEKKTFAPGVKHFGIDPDQIIFINTPKPRDMLWIIEEALKCESLAVVIGEIRELGFTESRRLMLAVERSGVTGFIHRYCPSCENAVACTTRWKITPLASTIDDDLPGVGHSCWDVQLLKVKNGKPDSWQVSWSGGCFLPLTDKKLLIPSIPERHAG